MTKYEYFKQLIHNSLKYMNINAYDGMKDIILYTSREPAYTENEYINKLFKGHFQISYITTNMLKASGFKSIPDNIRNISIEIQRNNRTRNIAYKSRIKKNKYKKWGKFCMSVTSFYELNEIISEKSIKTLYKEIGNSFTRNQLKNINKRLNAQK